MKKLMLFTLLLLSIITIKAQKTEFQDTWDMYTTPSTDNYYYYHFKKHLSSNLILSEKLSNKKKKIIVEFSLVNGVIENVKTNAANTLLKKEIIYAFNKLDFSKVSIQKNSVFHNYSLQLIEKSNGKNVLKCSSSVLHETPPICYNCEKRKDFESYNLCFKNKLEKYLFENIDSTKFSELKINMQEVDKPFAEYSSEKRFISSGNNPISIKVKINKNGQVLISNNAKDIVVNNEVNRILNTYNYENITPATYNNINNEYTYELKTSERRLVDFWFYKTSETNNLAHYFKNNVSSTLINKEFLDDKKNTVSISFSIDKKGKLENITSSAKNKELDKRLINVFKKYPVEKLKILEPKRTLSKYFFTVIVSDDFNNRIECNNYIFSESAPIAKGCENSKSHSLLLKCLQNSITTHVNRNFNSNIAKKLKLSPGVKRIYVMFRISNTGEITDVKARSPHKKLTEEAIRVAKSIKITSPGYQMGQPVGVKYSLPIAFRVEQKKTEVDPFKGMNTSNNKRRY